MVLNRRSLPFEVPEYSLTGDILSFRRCALQYRYYNGSSLPPSRPVQLWTGEFVHGVLEESYRYWHENQTPFPWPCNPTPWPPPPTPPVRAAHDIGVFGDLVETRLSAAGKNPRSSEARNFAYRRVEAAINVLGQHLFPLITAAEYRISGTRMMPQPIGAGNPTRGDRYELTGVIDVISSVVANAHPTNPLVQMIGSITASAGTDFDVIVDYKAARRSPTNDQHWHLEEWQVQTYAWLCTRVPQRPVGAGILVYINELVPSRTDLEHLRREILAGTTDVIPANGTPDYYALHRWQPNQGGPLPQFSQNFLLERAIRIVDVSNPQVQHAVTQIDQVVGEIETSVLQENDSGDIPNNWDAGGDEQDCVACDFRHFCPNPYSRRQNPAIPQRPPVAPGS